MPVLHIDELSVPCRGILFDKDGTLLDLLGTWGAWADLMLEGLGSLLALAGGRPVSGADLALVLGTAHNPAGKVTGYDPAGPLSMATAEETTGILAWQLYAAGMPWNEAVTRVNALSKEAMNELRRRKAAMAMPGLLPFLQQCAAASLKLGVVTSDQSETTGEQLEWLGISGCFQTVVTRDRVSRGKPAPEMAETACRELGLLPEETVIIGDSNADMQLGKGAGLRLAVGLASSGNAAHLLDADIVVSGYPQLRLTF